MNLRTKGGLRNTIVVLGASGYIGRELLGRFKSDDIPSVGTYNNNPKEGLIRFKLGEMTLHELDAFNAPICSHVIISAGAHAKIDESKLYWDESYLANVVGVKQVIDQCRKLNVIPIYISSDGIFDGRKTSYGERSKPNPVNCYGRMRFEVEEYIRSQKAPFIIIRAGRVFGTALEDGTLITQTLKELQHEVERRYISDAYFTPVYINDLYCFIKLLIESHRKGIFHVASLQPTTRYDIACSIIKYFGPLKGCAIPCSTSSLSFADRRPLNTSLRIEKYKKMTGREMQQIDYFLRLIEAQLPAI